MIAPVEFKQEEFDLLVYWIRTREAVRKAKEAGRPKPWTDDAIIANHRWCNVRRMDDKVSRWLLDHWYNRDADPATDMVAALLARLVNWPDALADVLNWNHSGAFHLDLLEKAPLALRARAERGEKVFTGAYVVPGVPGMNKVDSVVALVDRVRSGHDAGRIVEGAKQAWNQLIEFDGLGSFLAGQVVADMAFLRTGRDWEDARTWAPLGPGSSRGINRLRGIDKDKTVHQGEFEGLLAQLCLMLKGTIPEIWADRRLSAMDVQNCLCEFDKFRRLQLGEGQVRARYPGQPTPEEAQGGLF